MTCSASSIVSRLRRFPSTVLPLEVDVTSGPAADLIEIEGALNAQSCSRSATCAKPQIGMPDSWINPRA